MGRLLFTVRSSKVLRKGKVQNQDEKRKNISGNGT